MSDHLDSSSIVAGIFAVQSLLENSPQKINHLVFLKDSKNPKLYSLQKLADEHHLRIHQLPKVKLDNWYRGVHQGVLAFCSERELDDWHWVRSRLEERIAQGQAPRIVVPAAMGDPRNFGACIRSAVGFGTDVILSHNKGSCGLTPTASKAAAGAIEKIAICQVGDIEKELKNLLPLGFQIIGLDIKGTKTIADFKYDIPTVFMIGGEDRGIPPHFARACTDFAQIPISPLMHSYNASVALSLFLYEAARSDNFKRMMVSDPILHS